MMTGHRTARVAAIIATLPLVVAAQTAEMRVDDTALPYVDEGEGGPVLFVHGAISDLRVWEPYRPMISDERRFVAYTQRYFGTGEWPDEAERFQRSTHVADLIAFIEGLDAGPVDLVTWSYSGEIGVHAMLERPDLFRSAVHYEPVLDRLVDAAAGGDNATRELYGEFAPALAAVRKDRPEAAALRFIEAVFELPQGGAESEPGARMWRQNGRTVAPYLAMELPAAVDCATLGALRTPTLVVQGARSYARFSIMAERLGSCLANALTVTLPEVNHDGPYREPEAFASVIESFLSLLDREGRSNE